MNNISRILLSLFATALATFITIGVFFLLRSQPSFAQNKTVSNINVENQHLPVQKGRAALPAESDNNSLLKTLLSGDDLSFDEKALLAPQVENSQTLRIRLTSPDAAPNNAFSEETSAKTEFSLRQLKTSGEGLARQRNLELSPTQLLAIALDEKQQVLWWTLAADPRVLRVESADDAGRLSGGEIVYRNEAELLVSLPADNAIVAVRFYHPNWDGSGYRLEAIGNLDIPKKPKKKKKL